MSEETFTDFTFSREIDSIKKMHGAKNALHPATFALLAGLTSDLCKAGCAIDVFRKELFYNGHRDPHDALRAAAGKAFVSEAESLEPPVTGTDHEVAMLDYHFISIADALQSALEMDRRDQADMTRAGAWAESQKATEYRHLGWTQEEAGALLHASLGMVGDSIELLTACMQAVMDGPDRSEDSEQRIKVLLEDGDVRVWLGYIERVFEATPDEARERVMRKLGVRHPDGKFNAESGKEGGRDTAAEEEAAKLNQGGAK